MVEGSYYCTLLCQPKTFNLTREGIVELKIQDGALIGSMIGTFFWLPSYFCGGKVEGDEFEFDAPFNTACQQYILHVKGTVKGDTLDAIASSSLGDCEVHGYRVEKGYENKYGGYPMFQRTLEEREQRI